MSKRLLVAATLSFAHHVVGFTSASLAAPRTRRAPFAALKTKEPLSNPFLLDRGNPLPVSNVIDADVSIENEDAPKQSSKSSQLGAWIPLGSASCLDGLTPTQIQVCGLDLVVWQQKKKDSKKGHFGTFSAFMDACPHRLAPLSQGRVDPVTGCLECPYHGWTFDKNGNLTSIPQLENTSRLPKDGSATSLPVHAAGDLLFVFIPSDICGESWPIERLPEHHYPYLQSSIDTGRTYHVRELPYSVDFLLENFMDPAHIPFAHHSLQGVREDGSPIEMSVLANNFTHVEATFVDICNGKQRDGVLSFQRPAFYHFRTKVSNETEEYAPRLLIYVAPVRSGVCRTMIADFKVPLPKFLSHAASNRFLNSDSWLHDTERAVRMENKINQIGGSVAVGAARAGKQSLLGMNYISSSRSDLGPGLFRRWWHEQKLSSSPPDFFGPAPPSTFDTRPLTRAEQIDPWHSHSKHCSHCRKSLRSLKILQKGLVAVASSLVILLRNKPLIAIPTVLASVLSHNLLRKLVTVIEGNNHRGELADRSVAAMK